LYFHVCSFFTDDDTSPPEKSRSGNFSGLSIGIVNYARSVTGLQIGVINIVRNNPKGLRVLPLFNTNF